MIDDIENGIHSYYTGTNTLQRANIVVITGPAGKCLFADKHGSTARHLLKLPDISSKRDAKALLEKPGSRQLPEDPSDAALFSRRRLIAMTCTARQPPDPRLHVGGRAHGAP